MKKTFRRTTSQPDNYSSTTTFPFEAELNKSNLEKRHSANPNINSLRPQAPKQPPHIVQPRRKIKRNQTSLGSAAKI
eukprot:UN25814